MLDPCNSHLETADHGIFKGPAVIPHSDAVGATDILPFRIRFFSYTGLTDTDQQSNLQGRS